MVSLKHCNYLYITVHPDQLLLETSLMISFFTSAKIFLAMHHIIHNYDHKDDRLFANAAQVIINCGHIYASVKRAVIYFFANSAAPSFAVGRCLLIASSALTRELLKKIIQFSFQKMHLNLVGLQMSANIDRKWWSFCSRQSLLILLMICPSTYSQIPCYINVKNITIQICSNWMLNYGGPTKFCWLPLTKLIVEQFHEYCRDQIRMAITWKCIVIFQRCCSMHPVYYGKSNPGTIHCLNTSHICRHSLRSITWYGNQRH